MIFVFTVLAAVLPAAVHGLRPINTATRTAADISAANAWILKIDPSNEGLAQEWASHPLNGTILFDVPVPATLNDIVGAAKRVALLAASVPGRS